MACTNKELDNPIYTGLTQASQQQQQPLYDLIQHETTQYEMVEFPKERSLVPESKEVASSNKQQHSNSVDNHSNQKEQVKWLIVVILLITSTLLNVIVLVTFFTKETSCPQVSCPQVINTTQMAQDIAQAGYVSYGNTTDEMIFNLLTTLIDLVGDTKQLVNNNITTLIDMVGQLLADGTMNNVTASLQQLTSTQSIIEDISNENKGTINNILVNVLENENTSLIFSCQGIKSKYPTSPSGYYHIKSQLVYCKMGELCSSEGGWTRLAYLDMIDSTVDCPPGFKLYEDTLNGVRACGRPDTQGGSCVSIKFPSNGISYSEVCGRVVGYQYGSPDALYTSSNSIDSYYVDGVSITQGYPRKHVWALINGIRSSSTNTSNNCPCNTPPGTTKNIDLFIGNDYFCESGNPNNGWSPILYSDDPLWDGKQCGSQEQDCCSANGLPWFHKTLNSTTDYLELRVCCDQTNTDEDVPISFYELYVK